MQASPQSTLSAPTIFESWLPMDSESSIKGNCNASADCREEPEADFEEYRRQRARTAWKYAMWDEGCKLPTQRPSGVARCFCGTPIDIKCTSLHVYAAHMNVPDHV